MQHIAIALMQEYQPFSDFTFDMTPIIFGLVVGVILLVIMAYKATHKRLDD